MHCALCGQLLQFTSIMSFVLYKNQHFIHGCNLLEPSEGLQPHALENTSDQQGVAN